MGYLEGFIKQPVRTKNTNYITNPNIPCWRSNSCQDKEDRCSLLVTTWCMFSGILLSAKVLKYGCVIIHTSVLIVFEILRLVCITIYILFILTVTRFYILSGIQYIQFSSSSRYWGSIFYQVIGPTHCSAEKNRSTSWRTMLSTVNDILPILVPKLDISRANWAIFSLRLQMVIQGKELLGHFNRMSVCPVLTAV